MVCVLVGGGPILVLVLDLVLDEESFLHPNHLLEDLSQWEVENIAV